MGLGPIWRLRDRDPEAGDDIAPAPEAEVAAPPAVAAVEAPPSVAPPPVHGAPPPIETAVSAPRVADMSDLASLDWEALTERILGCRACALCEQRTQAVPGVGDRQADWLFVGEGPGAEEDARGEPFVGKAGKLLDAMLAAIDLKRGEGVYIANTVKCRPPLNRTPEASELAACFPYLARQIALIRPKLIVALGRPAAQSLLNTEIRIASARGRCFDYDGIPVVVTYHPAYLLRNPLDKAKAWEDLCFARRHMAQLSPGDSR
ncbi:uracil-DNA glycosylase [Nitrogeniibacter mangrovi]|uniref:Type-4 uracil-DNA glycosylase n=2 Tax=Nitrogeniibacter mangrovi TaxID=2016596 RepID=A0A6C1B8Q2_9RHOO|nr:uracil-DNA glycosylase [Nitrogeniibacter mangrovi]